MSRIFVRSFDDEARDPALMEAFAHNLKRLIKIETGTITLIEI